MKVQEVSNKVKKSWRVSEVPLSRSTEDTKKYQKKVKMATVVSMAISFCAERCGVLKGI